MLYCISVIDFSLMKRIIQTIALIVGFAVVAVFSFHCKKDEPLESLHLIPNTPLLSIDLQGGFDNDSVQVTLDGKELFSKNVTTNPLLSLAYSRRTSVSDGRHKIKVLIINAGDTNETEFMMQDTLTISVNYNKNTHEITFGFFNELLFYY